jgi:hypothetical protein
MSTANEFDANDLDWQAFCYAAGEFDVAEAAQFEARLADDQSAREALGRAVELVQTIAAAESQPRLVSPPVHARATWRSQVSWMAIGGVASLLIALLWSGVVGPSWKSARHTAAVRAHQQLASAWTATRHRWAASAEPDNWSSEVAIAEAEEWISDPMAADELDEAPTWLMAAVYARAASTASTDPDSAQRLEN